MDAGVAYSDVALSLDSVRLDEGLVDGGASVGANECLGASLVGRRSSGVMGIEER